MKKNNDGFTIVELIVVIAMLVIFIGAVSVNVGRITGYDAKEGYKKISSAITENKIETLGKAKMTGDIYLKIYKDSSDKNLYVETIHNGHSTKDVTDKTKLTKRGRASISYELSNGTKVENVDNSNPLVICFNRASGAIVDINIDDMPNSSYTVSELKYIYITAGSYKYTIELVPQTGKIIGK